MKPSMRKPVGVIAMLCIIIVWGFVIASVAHHTSGWPFPALAVFYLVAGIAWIFPLRPLLTWMETGRFR